MSPINAHPLPKLRPLDVRPITHEGQPYYLLRDPQHVSRQQVLVPQSLAAVLAFADGRHDVATMVAAFQRRYRMDLTVEQVEELLEALDEAVMLDNGRAAMVQAATVQEFRRAPFRTPALAGASYPAGEQALRRLLQEYLEAVDAVEPLPVDWSHPVGILSPHIDYGRGGGVYAQVWKRATQAAREAELVIMFGTDHYGSDLFSLTKQNYATPYGVLPTDQAIVNRLAAVMGEDAAYTGELRHRGEHSLELVTVWLHHARQGQPVPLVPLLVGSFHPFLNNGLAPDEHPIVESVLQTLREAMAGRRVLVVASGDLAHVGPAFGGAPLDRAGRERLRAADDALVGAMRAGDAAGFFDEIRQVKDCNNVCGVTPIYLTMRLIGDIPGEQLGYATCPADDQDTSFVTVTGMLFT